MRVPPLRVRILGHPIVMMPVMGMGLFTLYQWTQHPDLGVLAIAAVVAMVLVGKASERRMQFVRWRRAWDSMADIEPAARGPVLAKLAIALIVPAGFLAVEGGALDGLAALPQGWASLPQSCSPERCWCAAGVATTSAHGPRLRARWYRCAPGRSWLFPA